jgi:hypothetical protein
MELAAELADGADVALFVYGGVNTTIVGFGECRGLPKAGHATQPPCSTDIQEHEDASSVSEG